MREVGVLGQETVAGVDGVRAGLRRNGEQLADVQVRVSRRVAAQAVGLVGSANVHGIGVDVCVDSHGQDAGVVAGSGDADCDFATVRDQDLAHQILTSLGVVGTVVVKSGDMPGRSRKRMRSADGHLRGEIQVFSRAPRRSPGSRR